MGGIREEVPAKAKKLLRLGFSLALITLAITTLLAFLAAQQQRNELIDLVTNHLDKKSYELNFWLKTRRDDIQYIAKSPSINGLVRALENQGIDPVANTSAEQYEENIEKIFSAYLESNPTVVQVRYIGIADIGRELVRINKRGYAIERVAKNKLQQKGKTEYFQDISQLAKGQTYLSEINLNREFGKVEIPYLPVVRVGTPIYDEHQKLFGMLVINFDVSSLLNSIAAASEDKYPLKTFLINSNGDYLSHPNQGYTFGFDLGEIHNWYNDFTKISDFEFVAGESAGIAAAMDGHYIFNSQDIVLDEQDNKRNLKLITWVSSKAIQDHYLIVGAIVFFIGVLASLCILLYYYFSGVNRQLHEKQIELQAQIDLDVVFRQLIESASYAQILINSDGLIELVNTQAEKIFGFSREELLGETLEILIPKRYASHIAHRTEFFIDPMSRPMGRGQMLFAQCKDGSEIPVEVGLSRIDTREGTKVLAAVSDISERVRQQKLLITTTEDLERTNRLAKIGGWSLEVEENQFIFADAALKLLDVSETNSFTFNEALHYYTPSSRHKLELTIADAISSAKNWDIELELIQENGNKIWVRNQGFCELENNQVVRIIGTIQDITERKELEELFHTLVESSPNGMLMADKHGIIELVNVQVEKIFGYERKELIGQPVEILLPTSMRAQHPAMREGYIEKPQFRAMGQGRDLYGIRKDESEVPIEIGLSPINTHTGIKILCGIVEISERKQFELELRRRNQELDNFAYIASHDLKAPLRGIDQLATWIEEDLADTLNEGTKKHLRLMRTRINRMEYLLSDLLKYARAGTNQGEPEEINSAEIIKEIFELTCVNENFTLEMKGEFPCFVSTKVAFQLVIRNLITNALKHHDKDKGTISVSVSNIKSQYVFEVSDDGPGIAPENRERVFGLFQTLRPRDEVEGSGMGLAIVKKMVESFGGAILVTGNTPRGSVFSFSWPITLTKKANSIKN